jgi:hypothetical protein
MPTIRPEIFTTPDCPTVKFREGPELVNLDIEMPRILTSQGWGLGTVFVVQFVNHEKTKLIKVARFIVDFEDSNIQTFNPDGPSPMTKVVETRTAKQIESWIYPNGAPVDVSKKLVKWNFGNKEYEVRLGENVLFSSASKKEAEKFRDAA